MYALRWLRRNLGHGQPVRYAPSPQQRSSTPRHPHPPTLKRHFTTPPGVNLIFALACGLEDTGCL